MREMGINGYMKATCKICGKRFDWYSSSSFPFVDAEIIGTCNACFDKKLKQKNPSHR
jgi:hypothetical protein